MYDNCVNIKIGYPEVYTCMLCFLPKAVSCIDGMHWAPDDGDCRAILL